MTRDEVMFLSKEAVGMEKLVLSKETSFDAMRMKPHVKKKKTRKERRLFIG